MVVRSPGMALGKCGFGLCYMRYLKDQNRSESSICFANCESDSLTTLLKRTIVLNVGLSNPRSIKLMVVRSNPASKANCSWENPILFRLARRISPKALSGPERG